MKVLSRSGIPEETKAVPLGPILTPGFDGAWCDAIEEEAVREKLLTAAAVVRVEHEGLPAAVAISRLE